jgi:hypothetical protein
MKLYTVVTVDDYIPHVQLSTPDRDRALNYAKELAGDWHNEVTGDAGEIYFNQKEDGSMEYAVSVQEAEIDLPIKVDQVTRKEVADLASTILWNDGIEEFVPDMVDFARIAVKDSDVSCSDAKLLKAATHAAFGAMLHGTPLQEAIDTVLSRRGDILE